MHHYVGNYSSFLRSRAARQLQASQAYKAKQAEIERLQVFVDRFGAKATKASAANSRKKMIEKIKLQMPDVAPTEGQWLHPTQKLCRLRMVYTYCESQCAILWKFVKCEDCYCPFFIVQPFFM